MKKTYINPSAHTSNVKIRASILAGSTGSTTGQVNNEPVNGTKDNQIDAGAHMRNSISSLD